MKNRSDEGMTPQTFRLMLGIIAVLGFSACGGNGGSSPTPINISSIPAPGTVGPFKERQLTFMGTVYSPEWHDNFLYFSGFGNKGEVPSDGMLHDKIFRVYCVTPIDCNWSTVETVLDPIIVSGYTWQQAEGPNVVAVDDHLVMYYTCVDMIGGYIPEKGFTAHNNKSCYSTSYDGGASWSSPVKLLNQGWLPAAVKNPDGSMNLYANGNVDQYTAHLNGWVADGRLYRYTLSEDGTSVGPTRSSVVFLTGLNRFYFNVDVRYINDGNFYMMYAQHVVDDGKWMVDVLRSADGLEFYLEADSPIEGWTPAGYEEDPRIVYFGKSPNPPSATESDSDVDVFVNRWSDVK